MWSPLASEGGKTNPYKMNLESQPQVCFPWIPLCWAQEGRSYLRVTIEFLHACTFFNHWAHNSLWVVPFFFLFFTTANYEVIVYFPTGGCLGDASLSAKHWRNPQFLPTWVQSWGQSVKSCRTWRHVFRALCVFHRCALFLICTKATCCQALLWSLSLWCFGLRVWAIASSVSVFCLSLLAHGGCWNTLWCKCPMVGAWAILGGISMSRIWSMSKTWFYSNAHSDGIVRIEDYRLPLTTHMHSLPAQYFNCVQYDDIALNSGVVSVF